ncbi:MAG: His/Gly/Thr/Pro-type tRNA ligase C-terminal domain-containing protein, partial [Candidatus Thermoplasmatota archaeon]|nr:His/Gly/Thr/Pro-type tRNA ligase C-terminal domain-containing protein [Candidatus Thermoplasmatota archaeon]
DQWAKAFDITFENLNAEQQHVHQTTYGMSERLLGAVVGMHGDDNGLIMPPAIAPFQIVICPMIKKNSEVDTIGESNRIAELLRAAGLRVKVDSRDIRAGQKYYDWEIKGVPLRLDVGPRDMAQGTAFAALRTGGKEPLAIDNIVELCKQKLDHVAIELRKRSHEHMNDVMLSLPEFFENEGEWTMNGDILDGKIYEIPFDGKDAHAEVIEKLTGLTFLGDSVEDYGVDKPCHMTGKMTKRRVILAKTY